MRLNCNIRKFVLIALLVFFILLVSGTFYVASLYYYMPLKSGSILRVFKASSFNNRRSVIIILPGGGYSSLAKWNEGYLWIPFFHRRGYTVAVLEYRMPFHDYTIPKTDASEAIISLKQKAKTWGYDKDRIGLMGFSAGGHLASTMMVSEHDSICPDFVVLFYPVISMRKELTHMDTHNNLIGENASIDLECQFSNELHISRNNPPVFIAVSQDDSIVNPLNSIVLSNEINRAGQPVSLHIYPKGGHGWGYMKSFPYREQMKKDLFNWLDSLD